MYKDLRAVQITKYQYDRCRSSMFKLVLLMSKQLCNLGKYFKCALLLRSQH